MNENILHNAALDNALAGLEIKRKYIAAKKTQGFGAIGFAVLFFIVLLNFNAIGIGLVVGGIALITGIVFLVSIGNKTVEYRAEFKQQVIGAALSKIDQSLTIQPNEGIYADEFVHTQLFTNRPDRYQTEDFVSGKADKTSFYFAEVHAEYKTETHTKSGRQEHWHDILKGILFCADFNKNFNGVTVIRPKNFGSSLGAWFSKNVFSFGDKNVVELENDQLKKTFVTYSTDQIEARYILTPALMERVCELNEKCASTISLSFINSRMYIAFPLVKNYFEPPIFSSLLKPNLLDEDLGVLQFMYNIVKELDLNTRIWTKQ